MTATIRPNFTLLFDMPYDASKNQYCGIVTGLQNEHFVRTRWYKWGYKGPDFLDGIDRIEDIAKWTIEPDHPFFRRHGLPPAYGQPLEYDFEAINTRLLEYLIDYKDGHTSAADLQSYVEKLLKGHLR